jgi:hypothetical protein
MSPAVRKEKLKSVHKEWMIDNEPSEMCEQEEEAEVEEADEDDAGSGSSPPPSEDDEDADGAHVALKILRPRQLHWAASTRLRGRWITTLNSFWAKARYLPRRFRSCQRLLPLRQSKRDSLWRRAVLVQKMLNLLTRLQLMKPRRPKKSKRRRKTTSGFGNVGEDESG